MSLKARLRIAISLLMAAVVITLSLLYVEGFLSNELGWTTSTAKSIAGQIQATTRARLDQMDSRGLTSEQIKEAWADTVRSDPRVTAMMRRALQNWPLISVIDIAGSDGRVLASTTAAEVGRIAAPRANLAEWESRTVFRNAEDVFLGSRDLERVEHLEIQGENTPFLTTRVVISRPVLRESLYVPLERLGVVFALSLAISMMLAILLPNVVLDPLERLSKRLDQMATGKFGEIRTEPRREAKEFAAVYSKLDLLGQQFQGARENVADLRTNVEGLLERLEQAVLLVDPAGQLIMAGRNAGRLLGVDPETLSGQQVLNVVGAQPEMHALLETVLESRIPVSDRAVQIDSDEQSRTLLVTCEPLNRQPGGRALGTLIILRDGESRGRIEAELGLADRLAALSRVTRGVAHEIKNPLNAITLHLEMLRNRLGEPAPEVDVIGREISRLDRVVKTFLDFNRPIEPQMRLVDLSEIAREVGRLIDPQAAAKNIQLTLQASDTVLVNGDRDLLQQAILNVLMNALEAMPKGGQLTIESCRSRSECVLKVGDTGLGIPLEVRDRIFSLYFSTKKSGSGIGLAMAYRLVQLHDGKLEFSSEIGKGTTFRFAFPEALSAPPTLQVASRSHGA